MTQLIKWDQTAQKIYETGVSEGVLYVMDANGAYPKGVAWNGLIAVSEAPSGAEANPKYADNVKYINLVGLEEFAGAIKAYTYPEEFAECDGSYEIATGVRAGQQARKTFGLTYKTLIGNDVAGVDFGYKRHIVYGCLAAPSSKENNSVNETPEAMELSWDFTTTPIVVPGFKPTAKLVFDSTKVDHTKMAALEVILFGTTGSPNVNGRLPLPAEIITLMSAG